MSPRSLRLPEQHDPFAVGALERPFESVPDESAGEALEADRCSERAVLENSPIDVRAIDLELCLAGHDVALDGQRHRRRLASPNGRCRGAGPLAVIEAIGVRVAELQQEQQVDGRRDMTQAFHRTLANLSGGQ